MTETVTQAEALPADWPDTPSGLSTEAAAIAPAVIWQRLESFIAWRFSERSVTWIVQGCGEWAPPLKPATVTTTERWNGSTWETAVLAPGPLGYCVDGGTYRVVASVGTDDDVPDTVQEAYRRLAEHTAAIGYQSAGLRTETIPEVWSGEFDQRARARAMADSGAADLLRSYRR